MNTSASNLSNNSSNSTVSQAELLLNKLNFPLDINYSYSSEDFIISDKHGNEVADYEVVNTNMAHICRYPGVLVYKSIVEPIGKYESKFTDVQDKTIGHFKHRGVLTFNTRVKLFKNDVHCYTIKDSNLFMWLVRIIYHLFVDEQDDNAPPAWLTPTYKVLDKKGTEILRITRSKNPIHDKFLVEKVGRINPRDDGLILCGLLEMIYTELMLENN